MTADVPRFLADEDVDGPIVAGLAAGGFDITWVAQVAPGSRDADVLALAQREQRVLITSDTDFGELVFRQGLTHAGIVLLRLHGQPPAHKVATTLAAFRAHVGEMAGAFTVIAPGMVRIRNRIG